MNRHTLTSDASDGICIPRFSKRHDSEVFSHASTMSRRPHELPEGLAQQVASAVTAAIEVQLHDMTSTLVAAIHAAYRQESAGHLAQLSSRVVAGLAPELTKAVSNACARTEQTQSHVLTSTRQQARCLTAVSRYSSASKSCSSLTSSSKSSFRHDRDSRTVADGLAEETLRSQGLIASSSIEHGPSQSLKPPRTHDVSKSFLSVALPEEFQEPERIPSGLISSEFDTEDWQIQGSIADATQKPTRQLMPGELVVDDPQLACLSKDAEPSPRCKVSVQTSGDVLQVRVQELTEQIVHQDVQAVPEADGQERRNSLPSIFKLGGIVGWDSLNNNMISLIYQLGVLVLLVLAVTHLNYNAALVLQDHSSSYGVEVKERSMLLCDIAMAIGSMMGLLSMRPWSGSATLRSALSLLDAYSQRMGLLERWQKRVFREKLATCAILSIVIGSTWASLFFYSGVKYRSLTNGASFTVTSTVLVCLNFAMQHVCGYLLMFVDAFCCVISEAPEVDTISNDWNILQAVLRKGASSVELCFVWTQGTVALAVPLAIADMAVYGFRAEVIAMLVPRFALLLQALRTLFLAASLTCKCDSVPPVVNALHFGWHTESLRQHIVNYISSSAAGFHVCHVRVSMGMAIKYVYVWVVVVFALWTQFLAA
eukprot:TRINITY_DN9652_c0_g5_i1.p1 TRINITY_DN9652_c0_g5~~TRINITY_DN9652_c0_g5_i1.p1  ORF type:complete len:701 (-),score=58.21 TRINITY_DN9652_c0_g5_i1:182-2140(-)